MAGQLGSEYVAATRLNTLLTTPGSQSEDTGIRQVPKSYQTTILNGHHEEFREKLNFTSILSRLNKHGLIPHGEYAKLQDIPPTATNYDKIDRLFAIIPSCGHDNFLICLIRCLRESASDAGEAHEELADSLQKALDNYVPAASASPPKQDKDVNSNNMEDGNEFVMVGTESALILEEHGGGGSLTFRNPNQYTDRQGRYGWRHCCFWSSCYSVVITLLVLEIVGLVSLSQLPHSTSTTPFVLQRASRSLTAVEFGLDSHWISTIDVRLDSPRLCTGLGTVHVILGSTCDSLPTQTEQVNDFYDLIYLLAGSQITITVGPNFQGNSVWIVSSISAYNYATPTSYVQILPDDCSSEIANMPNYNCFEADKYNTTNPIVLNVKHSGYYSLFVANMDRRFTGLVYSAKAITYNLTEINHVSQSVKVSSGSVQQFHVNDLWKFKSDPTCVLFESSCENGQVYVTNLTVLSVQKRRDVLLFPSLFVFCTFFVLILLIAVHVLRWKCAKI